MIIDVHCHYTLTDRRATVADRFSFEPGGEAEYDSCVAPRLHRQFKWRLMRKLLGLPPELQAGPALDAELERVYDRHLTTDGPIERYVLLAFDRYYTQGGDCPPFPTRTRERGSDIYTSNTLVRDLCRRNPQRFLFGASVHPYRLDALRCIDEVFAAGACLMKWLPLHQNIDPDDPRTLAALAHCAEIGLPLLVHFGPEFTLRVNHPEHEPASAMLRVLRELRAAGKMPPTIFAHVATPSSPFQHYGSCYAVIEALRSRAFADAPLYADISALTAWGKFRTPAWIAGMQDLHPRLLFGSDFPVPLGLPMLRGRLRGVYHDICRTTSWPEQAVCVYRHLGFNEIVFQRAAMILPNVEFFTGAPFSGDAVHSVGTQ